MNTIDKVSLYVKTKMLNGQETFSIRQLKILFDVQDDTPIRKGIYNLRSEGYVPFRHKDNNDLYTVATPSTSHKYKDEILAEWGREDKTTFNRLRIMNKVRKSYPIYNQQSYMEELESMMYE